MIYLKDRNDIEHAMELFNRSVDNGELLYKPFSSVEDFESFFINRKDEGLITINILSNNRRGFASGCYVNGLDKGYITVISVDKASRRKGIGKTLLKELEAELKKVSEGKMNKCEIIFFNPMSFSWIVPNTVNHDHPNAPGVDISSEAYIFFKNCGYRDTAYQNSYYVDLATYEFPEDITRKIEKLKESNIEITIYDENKHSGLSELFDNLDNKLWTKEIMANVQRDNGGDPVLIVNVDGKAMGFTGPLSIQPSGRGYFCGIGVHSACRGNGAGKVLFAYLCKTLKGMGARFMTLFTGETNPARNIYEAAGFKIVRSWADMKKDV